jgi:putative endonuclease
MSARLPIGVATTYSAPAGNVWAPAAAAAACTISGAAEVVTRFPTTKQSGDAGEDRALALLLAGGLTLVQRNYRVARGPRSRGGEIDLVLQDADGTLVFVEVRRRGDLSHGGAAASVGAGKQRTVVFAARHFLQRWPGEPPCRFDVVAIDGERIEWLRAAFDAC